MYKAKQLWSTWTEHGPKSARYNNSPSGWFDMNTFNDFFYSYPTEIKQTRRPQGNNRRQFGISYVCRCPKSLWRRQCKVCVLATLQHSSNATLDVALFTDEGCVGKYPYRMEGQCTRQARNSCTKIQLTQGEKQKTEDGLIVMSTLMGVFMGILSPLGTLCVKLL
nr:unnamed protein product [Callosobruchus analis]